MTATDYDDVIILLGDGSRHAGVQFCMTREAVSEKREDAVAHANNPVSAHYLSEWEHSASPERPYSVLFETPVGGIAPRGKIHIAIRPKQRAKELEALFWTPSHPRHILRAPPRRWTWFCYQPDLQDNSSRLLKLLIL